MPKHAIQRSRRLGHLKVVASVVLVVAFLSLAVGGATGMIGSSDGGGDGRRRRRWTPPAGDRRRHRRRRHGQASPSDEPTEIVTDVPPQHVKGAKKLKRTLAWLRRGLADETTFRVGTFNVLGSSHTAQGRQPQGLRLGLHPDGHGLVADRAGGPLGGRVSRSWKRSSTAGS